VGKSSLINALTNRKNLARASNTPGRTQEINYFTLGDDRYLVDLPGYGFAEAPVVIVTKWQALLKQYLQGRQTLRRAFVLIDMRHGVKAVDEEILTLLDRSAVTFQVVMTKADKVNRLTREANIAQTMAALQKHPAAFPEIVVTSSEKGRGDRDPARPDRHPGLTRRLQPPRRRHHIAIRCCPRFGALP
jgi:GTP-binding protein